MRRCIRHYAHFARNRKNRRLHQVACVCAGHGFRYHILQIGR